MTTHNLFLPVTNQANLNQYKRGDFVYVSGKIFAFRDAAHKRLVELLLSKQALPIDLQGQGVYYMGPSPTPPGKICGAAGPTTSRRMDRYTPTLLEQGVKVMLGKGSRSEHVEQEIVKHHALYLATIGGAGALLGACIKSLKVVCFEDLGPEAIHLLEIQNIPCIVSIVK